MSACSGTVAAKLAGTAATDGTLQWRSGTIRGPLTVDKITTDIGANSAESRRYLDPPTTARRPP